MRSSGWGVGGASAPALGVGSTPACSVSLQGLPPDPCADRRPAAVQAAEQVRAVEDSPAERRRVAAAFYAADGRRAFGRAELRFLHWEIGRGVLHPVTGRHPGSPWWRAVNARLLRDKVEADLLSGGAPGRPSSPPVALWLAFIAEPTPLSWYRAHNASIAAAYLDHEASGPRRAAGRAVRHERRPRPGPVHPRHAGPAPPRPRPPGCPRAPPGRSPPGRRRPVPRPPAAVPRGLPAHRHHRGRPGEAARVASRGPSTMA